MFMFLTQMEPWHWMALGAALLAVEALLGTELLLGMGLAGLAVAAVYKLVPDLTWQVQLVWFAIFSVAFTVLYWKKFRAATQETDQPLLNNRTAQLVGKQLPLFEPIVNGTGKVQIADALWAVKGVDSPKDTVVRVVGAEGMTLVVECVAE
mgnify:CR=1 FL=1